MSRTVQLDWGGPCRWDMQRGIPPQQSEVGVYQITRQWAGWESLLYIGIVWSDGRTFNQRMNEHRSEWLSTYRGVYFRFAHIVPLRGLTRDRALVEEIEGALVCQLKPPENTSKMKSYSLRSDLYIVSTGSRGMVPKRVDTLNHAWVGQPGGRATYP